MKTKAIIVDIDGTLSDLTHRLHHVKNPEGKKHFDNFFAEAHKDTPKQNVIDVIRKLQLDQCEHCYEEEDTTPAYTTLFVTGRPEKLRAVTQN